MKRSITALLLSSLLIAAAGLRGSAQEKLTLEQAVKLALENNYDIKLVSNDLEISKNNVSRGAMLPVVSATSSGNRNNQNTRQTQSNGQVINRNGAKNSSLSYGVGLSWRVFDGLGMFANYDRLQELEHLGEANLKATVLRSIFSVINTYYDLVRQHQQLKASTTALELSQLRLKNANARYQTGRAAKLEVLAATVDLNTDTTSLLRQRDLIRSTKIQLNELIARDVNTDFTVTDTIIIQPSLQQTELLARSLDQNPALQVAVINQKIAELNLKTVKAARYPVLNLNSGYNFSNTTSELGFAQQSRGRGFNYGFTASLNIFSGLQQRRNEKNAEIQIDNTRIDLEKLQQNVRSQFASAYQTYLTNLELVRLEDANLDVARQNMDITLEKYRLGSIAPLEFREAQRNYVDASVRYSTAQYEAKMAELSLKEISGTINLEP